MLAGISVINNGRGHPMLAGISVINNGRGHPMLAGISVIIITSYMKPTKI